MSSTKGERYRNWYKLNKVKVNEHRRDKYHKRKAIPVCPRCGSNHLETKPWNEDETFVLCKDCRKRAYTNQLIRESRRMGFN